MWRARCTRNLRRRQWTKFGFMTLDVRVILGPCNFAPPHLPKSEVWKLFRLCSCAGCVERVSLSFLCCAPCTTAPPPPSFLVFRSIAGQSASFDIAHRSTVRGACRGGSSSYLRDLRSCSALLGDAVEFHHRRGQGQHPIFTIEQLILHRRRVGGHLSPLGPRLPLAANAAAEPPPRSGKRQYAETNALG